jgi:hypothetical protein
MKNINIELLDPNHELITVNQAVGIIGKSWTSIYEAYRQRLFSAYVKNRKVYLVKSEVEAAKENFPRVTPFENGFYPRDLEQKPINSKNEANNSFTNNIIINYKYNVA